MKYQRWVACGDNHGDQVDPGTRRAFFEFVKSYKPDIKIHAGDNWDFRWLRSKASDEDRRQRIDNDFEAGNIFLGEYAPDVMLLGNHDWRLWRAAMETTADGPRAKLVGDMLSDALDVIGKKTRLYDYDKRKGVHLMGERRFIHGYHTGLYAVKNAAQLYGNVCMWHIHAPDSFSIPRLERTTGYSSGCLCRVDLDYNRGQPNTLRQINGWLYGLLFPGGRVTVWSAERVGNTFYLPSEMREVKCAG